MKHLKSDLWLLAGTLGILATFILLVVPVWVVLIFLRAVAPTLSRRLLSRVIESNRNNCYTFAFAKLLQDGGYLVLRKSDLVAWVVHSMWGDLNEATGHVDVFHYVPSKPRKGWWPQMFFKGRIKVGDKRKRVDP